MWPSAIRTTRSSRFSVPVSVAGPPTFHFGHPMPIAKESLYVLCHAHDSLETHGQQHFIDSVMDAAVAAAEAFLDDDNVVSPELVCRDKFGSLRATRRLTGTLLPRISIPRLQHSAAGEEINAVVSEAIPLVSFHASPSAPRHRCQLGGRAVVHFRVRSRTVRRVLNKRGSCGARMIRTKERRCGWESGTTAELWFSAAFLSVCWCVSWFPWPVLSPSWLPVSLGVVAPNPRILEFEFVGNQRSISLCDISCFFSVL